MSLNNRETGTHYEERASAYLEQMGYEILLRNYRCKSGEIDLIARDGSWLVFTEVKYRKDAAKGLPEEAVDIRKQQRIYRAAQAFLQRYHVPLDTPCRFDVVAIEGESIRHLPDAFGGF